jgi:hypothetical protein
MINSIGQKVYEGNQNQITIANFSKGLYILQIEFENGIKVTEKVMKE